MAARNVAGVPAAARAVHELSRAGIDRCWLIAGQGGQPDPLLRAEVERLAGAMAVEFASPAEVPVICGTGTALWLAGEAIVAGLPAHTSLMSLAMAADEPDPARAADALDMAARRIVAASGKPGDGIVSRTLNRPISQAISRLLLRFPGVRPVHATSLTALLASAMMLCLLGGGETGLIAGALLFQAASVVDGVDGELARTTFRSTSWGAKLDSLIDAAASIGFIAGVAINLWIAGNQAAALTGFAGLAMMGLGLFVIGRQAARSTGPFTFNAVKDHFSASGSRLMQWLTWLTMRDFFALAAVILVVAGLAEWGLLVFAIVAAGWLSVVLFVMGTATRQTA